MVLQGSLRSPDIHDLSEWHRLYYLGRYLLPPISLTVLTLTPKKYLWDLWRTTLTIVACHWMSIPHSHLFIHLFILNIVIPKSPQHSRMSGSSFGRVHGQIVYGPVGVVTFRKGGKLLLCFFVSSPSHVSENVRWATQSILLSYIFIISGPWPFKKYMSPLATLPESQTPFFRKWLKG